MIDKNLGTVGARFTLDLSGLQQGKREIVVTMGQIADKTRETTATIKRAGADITISLKSAEKATTSYGAANAQARAQALQFSTALRSTVETTLVAKVALTTLTKAAIESKNAYRDYNEQVNKSKEIFKGASAQVSKFAETSADSLGMSKTAALEATATFGALMEQLELGPQKTAAMSMEMVKLAGDLASFHNLKPEEAFEKLRAGLSGEAEPLRALGLHLDDATLRLRAMNEGLVKSTNEVLPPQIKMLAAYKEIVAQTKTAQGDFARTSTSVANAERILAAQIENTQIALGEKLMPVWGEFLKTTLSLATAIKLVAENLDSVKASPGMQQFLANIKDAAEILQRFGNQMAFENSPEGKVAQKRDDATFFQQMLDKNGNPIFPQTVDERLDINKRFARYGQPEFKMGTGSADFKQQIMRAQAEAEKQYNEAFQALQYSQFHTPDSKSAGDRFMESYQDNSVPSYIRRQREEEAKKDAEAAEKARKKAEAERKRKEGKQNRYLDKMIRLYPGFLLDVYNSPTEMLRRFGYDDKRAKTEPELAFGSFGRGSSIAKSAAGILPSAEGTATKMRNQGQAAEAFFRDAAEMDENAFLAAVQSGQISPEQAIKILETKIAHLEANKQKFKPLWKKFTDQKNAFVDAASRSNYERDKANLDQEIDQKRNQEDYNYGRGNTTDSERMKQLRDRQDALDADGKKFTSDWFALQREMDDITDRSSPGKAFERSMKSAFENVRMDMSSFSDFWRSTMRGLVDSTREAISEIIKIWAKKQIGKGLGAYGGPIAGILGDLGGSIFGGIFGRSVQMPGYVAPSGSRAIQIAINGPVNLSSERGIQETARQLARHLDYEARTRG